MFYNIISKFFLIFTANKYISNICIIFQQLPPCIFSIFTFPKLSRRMFFTQKRTVIFFIKSLFDVKPHISIKLRLWTRKHYSCVRCKVMLSHTYARFLHYFFTDGKTIVSTNYFRCSKQFRFMLLIEIHFVHMTMADI